MEKNWWQTTDFDFIRIPKELFRNPYYGKLSAEGKLLYGFLLDRVSLSWVSGEKWRTPDGDPFVIFTLAEIQQRIGCGDEKATRLLRNLESLNLIGRTRPKRDGPYHITIKAFQQVSGKAGLPTQENTDSRDPEIPVPDSGKSGLNNTDNNKTDRNKTERITLLEERIKSQIQYDFLISECPRNQVDTIVDVMVQTLTSPAKTITVAGVPMDGDTVRAYLEKAEVMRIQYIFDHMDAIDQPIRSYRAYYLARLCDPEGAVDAFYEQQHRLNSLDSFM